MEIVTEFCGPTNFEQAYLGGGTRELPQKQTHLGAKTNYSANIRGKCVHHVRELAVHGWVAPCVRRNMRWDESARASLRRTHAKTSKRFFVHVLTKIYSAKNCVMCVHLALKLAVHGWVAPCVRRNMGWDESARASLGRTSIHFLFMCLQKFIRQKNA